MSRTVLTLLSRRRGANRSSRKEERASWRAPLRRARRAIACSVRRVETSGRVIDATLRFAAGRPLETSSRLFRLGDWISDAARQLERAAQQVGQSVDRAEVAPELAIDAPPLLAGTAAQWLDAARRLNDVSLRLVEASAHLRRDAQLRALPLCAAPAPSIRSKPAQLRPSPLVLVRRQRMLAATAADAARKHSRGRAPPQSSFAPLHHRE